MATSSPSTCRRMDTTQRHAQTQARIQKAAILMGPISIALFMFALVVVARFVPAPDPSDSPNQVAALYRDHQDRIRAGAAMIFVGLGFLNFFVAAISHQLKRIPGPAASTCAQTQLIGGALGTFMILWAPMIWVAAAFRPEERSPETLATLHDLAWIAWVGNASFVLAQSAAIAVAVFSDAGTRPVYPRWIAYLNVWVVILYLPTAMDIFFTNGMFSWNGVIPFWIPAFTFFIWIIGMTYATFGAIDDETGSAVGSRDSTSQGSMIP